MIQRVYDFDSETQDVVQPAGKRRAPNVAKALARQYSKPVYTAAKLFGYVLCPGALHVRVANPEVLAPYQDQGYFLYGNHTQPMGDAFFPMVLTHGRSARTIANVENLQVPILGPYLQMGGALVVPPELHAMPQFLNQVTACIQAGQPVTVYPEAHVWPYDTHIRPFTRAAFHYPVALQVPSFSMTTTYQQRRWGSRPKITVYLDGPFLPDRSLAPRAQQAALMNQIHARMVARAKEYSTYAYVTYRKREVIQ